MYTISYLIEGLYVYLFVRLSLIKDKSWLDAFYLCYLTNNSFQNVLYLNIVNTFTNIRYEIVNMCIVVGNFAHRVRNGFYREYEMVNVGTKW